MGKQSNFKTKLMYSNAIINTILIFMFIFTGAIWADSNGIWHFAEDIRPGVFGLDENANLSNNYTFINNVKFNSTISLNGFESCSLGTDSAGKMICDQSMLPLLNCHKQGLLLGETGCRYPMGVDITPDSFTFNNVSGAELNTMIASNTITIQGFSVEIDAKVAGDPTTLIVVNGITVGQEAKIKKGDTLAIKVRSSNEYETTRTINLSVGTYKTKWSVKTKSMCKNPGEILCEGTIEECGNQATNIAELLCCSGTKTTTKIYANWGTPTNWASEGVDDTCPAHDGTVFNSCTPPEKNKVLRAELGCGNTEVINTEYVYPSSSGFWWINNYYLCEGCWHAKSLANWANTYTRCVYGDIVYKTICN